MANFPFDGDPFTAQFVVSFRAPPSRKMTYQRQSRLWWQQELGIDNYGEYGEASRGALEDANFLASSGRTCCAMLFSDSSISLV